MSEDPVVAYHDRTKHGFQRFAKSLGYLDWATQPEPFRVFDGAERVPLAFPVGDGLAYDALSRLGSREPAPLAAEAVADLFLHSLALSAWKQAGPNRWALRVNPSSGNLHPTEGYAVLPAVEGIDDAPGVYHYLPRDHVLERRASLTEGAYVDLLGDLPEGSFLLGLTSIPWREAWKYGERAFRYCQHDTGHAIAALRLAGALHGWHVRALTGWSHDAVAAVLGLDREIDFPVPEEREDPELLLAVTPGPIAVEPPAPAPETLAAIRAATWSGVAEPLSSDHVDWEVIDEVAADSRHPGGPPIARDLPEPPVAVPAGRGPADARRLLHQRRSAVMFDGRSSIPLGGCLRILERTLPAARPPFDAIPWRPRIHLALFVHAVDGLMPGLYLLVRDPRAREALRAAIRKDAAWAPPEGVPDGFPLYRLVEGDCRALAARLSCTQEIAGASFFSLGMIAEFDASLRDPGPWFYRNLFWEAGAVGQVLYLEAEAEGARGTGIGCYFDDPVHEVLGLTGRAWQSLYHFTIGIPVEDDRLSTLPPYPAEVRAR